MFSKNSSIQTNQETKLENHLMFIKERYFLICESCLWCASNFKGKILYAKCPFCNDSNIEFMPIGIDEKYSFNHSPKRGVELNFSNDTRV